jgi:hypothetical protein
MSYKATGSVIHVGEVNQISDKFKKRDLVLSIADGEYEQKVSFEFHQDRADALEELNHQDQVEVSFDLRGREWTNKEGEVKYFNTLVGWKFEKLDTPNTPEPAAKTEEEEDLPF